jgi:hypothetical protein
MQWPTLIVDDFFNDPHEIVKLSKTFKYAKAVDDTWPGTRSPPTHTVHKKFFLWSTEKILSVLYPMHVHGLKWQAVQYFQRVPYTIYGGEGWIHRDQDWEFTSIVYLSDHPESGTCLYKNTDYRVDPDSEEERRRFNRDLTDFKRQEKYRKKANNKFNKKVELFSNFNRLVLFDGWQWHGSKNSGKNKEERLTLVTFFKKITFFQKLVAEDVKYPIPTMRRI